MELCSVKKKEKTVPKGYILHDSIYMAFLKRQNYKDGERFCCQGWGRRKRREVGYGYKMVPLAMLVLELLCGGGHIYDYWYKHVIKLNRSKYTHNMWVHVKLVKSYESQGTVSILISSLCYYTILMQDAAIVGSWMKGTWVFLYYFLQLHLFWDNYR